MTYNSFLDRSPFGAVVVDTTVTWRYSADDQTQQVTLMLYRDGDWHNPHEVPMQRDQQQFVTETRIDTVGLWFYAFLVNDATGQFWYGCPDGGDGGLGQMYADRDHVQMYQLTVMQRAPQLPAWYQRARVYHIFVDRFNNGNADGHVNHPKPDSFLYGQLTDRPYYIKDENGQIVRWDFYGGNLKGITKKIPYLQSLGINALYLSPIFEARSNHRYDTGDYFKIDPMLGDLNDFDELIATAHAAGMHVILDGVFNHVGADSRYFNAAKHYPRIGATDSRDSPYADWFMFKHFPDDYASWWGVKDLPAINKDNTDFHDFIAGPDGVIDYWTKRGVDGWRLDVADELSDPFLDQIKARLAHYPDRVLIGEVWEDASHKVAYGSRRRYLLGDQLDAVMNYPLRQLIIDLVLNTISPASFINHLMTLKENYPQATFANNFNLLDSHDTRRILTTLDGDKQRMAIAIALLYTLPGVPVLYYGDEAGLTGGVDPDNRAYYPWTAIDQQTMALFQQAIEWRDQAAFATDSAWYPFSFTGGLGYLRESDHATSLVLINVTAAPLTIGTIDWTLVPANKQLPALASRTLAPFEVTVSEDA
ncbi:glycoside hydrolase family 13 protein [Lacticaseibacillus saniviri]|uniref:Amylopullulanase n=1 Tax=Lacticaseibacillus saniviri JCM 17471 = DSM 24301 TaxID=1293598 RepID=A0A0R2MZ32_9LACO|nr:glycoside hydrolase family 13 protein [Lacticaseibacillus saniviri]KRO16042.1 amylopullulanase [Lacticaseibacillus saniviri JCM 17471 = DSM 24301]MCG4282907.1 glycoside hydrolase family 13 protein [Lacticaseibacillus saniviri]